MQLCSTNTIAKREVIVFRYKRMIELQNCILAIQPTKGRLLSILKVSTATVKRCKESLRLSKKLLIGCNHLIITILLTDDIERRAQSSARLTHAVRRVQRMLIMASVGDTI